ncbi:MAG: LSU ribosomal protein L10P [Parcubacteria group bacterium Greene0416_14]|nr:MAG: LSU ribosomal protein L10P [Parcubacteria group bacterium Greene0416_14]TSC99715.1 MAG: LSU ribosomal protein L10P [Parcubacteria group bacterium Greene1014_15]TSD07778.1 MAG: LSU ribosomal protein L10P [Parcubacteria group bacterium Greene0714_4]
MAITKQKKTEILQDIEGIIDGAISIVFVRFTGLAVAETTAMRKGLREKGVGYRVAKKTLMKRVLSDRQFAGELPELAGEVAIAYGNDALAPAREVYTFEKQFKDKVAIVGGIFENKYMNASEMTVIASIPPLQVLRSQFVNLINSPIQRIVTALDRIAVARS